MPEIAPGPPGDPLLGHLRPFRRDVLGLLTRAARDHGDVVRFRIGPMVVHLVNHPDHVTHVLQRRAKAYDKATRSTAALRAIAGTSLLTANGEAWQTRRRLMQPVFHRKKVCDSVPTIVAAIDARLRRWQPGGTIDLASEMMQLAFDVAGAAILGVDVGGEAASLEADIGDLLAQVFDRWGRVLPLPWWVPTAGHRRFAQALARVDRVVAGIVAHHRTHPEGRPPLLAQLMDARDPVSGAPFTDAELRHEVITMLLAGHETTASALAWTFALLAQHPSVADRLQAELEVVLGSRTPARDDLPALPFTTQVIHEAMRLYPPIWAIERRACEDDTLGGFVIPAGSSVVISPYVLHRHPAFWPDAERFDPGRFASQHGHAAYLPFGAGPRYCIGAEFGMTEARLVVAMTLQRWRLSMAGGALPTPQPGLTLRVRGGLPMQVTPR